MVFSFSPTAHQRACTWKQRERELKLESYHESHSSPLTPSESDIHALSIRHLVEKCNSGEVSPFDIMHVYGKKALQAHSDTNCIADFMLDDALRTPAVASWGPGESDGGSDGIRDKLLMGVPVSIKDTINIAGHDTTVGFSRNVNRPAAESAAIVRLLQDAGALVHVKTTVPTGLIGLETSSDLFGQTSNPYNKDFTSGASTGGGAALVGCGGTKIEMGTDLAGSVRIPAHFCGVWSLKGSVGRFPNWGSVSSMMGLESIPIVSSPLAGNLDDLHEFSRRVVLSKPWQYDHTCVPLPWRPVNLREEGRRLKWGVIWSDGVIPPTPACKRALSVVIAALKRQGHEVVDFAPPDISEGLKIGYQLLFSDGGQQIQDKLQPSEAAGAAATAIFNLLAMPRILKKALAYFARPSDPLNADLLEIMNHQTIVGERALVVRRDEYRAAWHDQWMHQGLDFVLTVPHPTPAMEHGKSEKSTLISAGYTFIFSLLDYVAGVLPVTHVDKELDALPNFSPPQNAVMNSVCKGTYSTYDTEKMHGLPVGVQVVGRRLEEEKVLEGMKVIEEALAEAGTPFVGRRNV